MADKWSVNPWVPITKPIDLKHLGKLAEELGELTAAVSRCIIQGIEGIEPNTGKVNREWLEEEIADVLANLELVAKHFKLEKDVINTRQARKMKHLKRWHDMLQGDDIEGDSQCNFSKMLQNKVMSADNWSILHEQHLNESEQFQTVKFKEHPSGNWYWVVCPCGAKFLSISEAK